MKMRVDEVLRGVLRSCNVQENARRDTLQNLREMAKNLLRGRTAIFRVVSWLRV